MTTLILDVGNSIVKARSKSGSEMSFPHALRYLSEAEYAYALKRTGSAGLGLDYMRINGQPLVVGRSAESFGIVTRMIGAAKFDADYYGVLAAAAAARVFERGGEIVVFGSHAPGDIEYREDLMKAVMGNWVVEIGGSIKNFKVIYSNAFDEGLGGWANVVLTQEGTQYARTDVNGGNGLIFDIGGGTTDFIAVAEGGKIDYSLQYSAPIGIIGVLEEFEKSLRSRYRDMFKDNLKGVRPERIRQALRTGFFVGAGDSKPCEEEAKAATSVFLNQIIELYQQQAGGASRWDCIILTGGGIGAVYERLLPLLKHGNVVLADQLETIHMANVRGGAKLYRLFESEGWL